MQYIRVIPIGSGKPGDELRVPLPTYRQIADLPGGSWIIEVRDEDVPTGAPAPINVNVPGLGNVSVIANLPASALATWKTTLDARYPRRDKSSDPNVV